MATVALMAVIFPLGLPSPHLSTELICNVGHRRWQLPVSFGGFPQKFGLEVPPFTDQAPEHVLPKQLAQWSD